MCNSSIVDCLTPSGTVSDIKRTGEVMGLVSSLVFSMLDMLYARLPAQEACAHSVAQTSLESGVDVFDVSMIVCRVQHSPRAGPRCVVLFGAVVPRVLRIPSDHPSLSLSMRVRSGYIRLFVSRRKCFKDMQPGSTHEDYRAGLLRSKGRARSILAAYMHAGLDEGNEQRKRTCVRDFV